MSYLDAAKISAIEQELTQTLIARFGIDLSCLLYDTTNFHTFIDSFNPAPGLAQRGKAKQKRMDLRLVGLALLVTKDFHIPLLHEVYPGNLHDAPTFASVTETLLARYRLFAQSVEGITLVYDKGNNSQATQGRLDGSPYHFVGSVSPAQHPDLLRIRRARWRALEGDDLQGVLAWRTRKDVLGAERTVLVTYNPDLFLAQSATILREVRKRTRQLGELQRHLRHPPARGKRPTVESVRKQVEGILAGRHMKELIRVELPAKGAPPSLHYQVDQAAWSRLQRTLLGKNILFTHQDAWSDEEIVRAYRGQYQIEEAFKRMKDPHFVSWHPLHHWTDQKIRVHAFYCVLALLLAALLRRTLAHQGIDLSIVKLLSTLAPIKEVALVYRGPRSRTAPVISYSQANPLQRRLMEALALDRFKAP